MSLADAPIPDVPAAADAGTLAGYRFTVVPHTHWDREWYQPFEVFRMRLARAVGRICDVLETDPRFTSFTLDGQAVILEDVVELRPDLDARLRRLITEGRLEVGPSYVLPDEFLAGQEALVRNLLHGRTVCERFGARPMAVGYMPDPFGHVGQMPQILRGFGLDAFIFWRGLGDEADRLGLVFAWEAPDGSRVTAIRQLGSYGNANQLGRWAEGGVDLVDHPDRYPDTAADRFRRYVRTYHAELERTPTPELFLCNGSDHEEIHERLPELLEHARAVWPETKIEIGTYERYVDRLRPTLDGMDLPVLSGELVGGRDAPVLRGINSVRIGLKQAAERTERALLVAETLASLAWLDAAAAPPADELRFAWRELLRNLAHDSISGCSVDGTHRDMAQRFVNAQRVADRVSLEAMCARAGVRASWSPEEPTADSWSVHNPLGFARRGLVRIPRGGWMAMDIDGFAAKEIQGTAQPDSVDAEVHAAGDDSITNGSLTVRALADGSVEVTDERSGRSYTGLHRFEDVADRGDEYNFCHLEGDRPISVTRSGRVRMVARGPVLAELEVALTLELPRSLSRDRSRRVGRVAVPVRSRIRLFAGSDRIEFETTIDNRARDHRLRVRFAAEGATAQAPVRAEGHFGIVRRPARPTWKGSGWVEPPALTAHTTGMVAWGDVAIIGRGLPEYEAVPDAGGPDLALTLLRCVGWLSRDDLETRPGHAGPGVPTPEAQALGRATFEYALRVGVADESDGALLRDSADYRTPLVVGPAGAAAEPPVRVEGEVLVSALKPAEDGRGVVLRAYNAGLEPAHLRVIGDVAISQLRLDETDLPGEDPERPLRPGEIRSVRLVRR
jgi:mannosylglycerate hydrolase